MSRSEGMSPAYRLDRAVTLNAIDRQRDAGWPDLHPEDFCHRCGRRNIGWHVDSELWDVADPGTTSIFCPQCFVELYELETGTHCHWELRLDISNPADVHTHHPEHPEEA